VILTVTMPKQLSNLVALTPSGQPNPCSVTGHVITCELGVMTKAQRVIFTVSGNAAADIVSGTGSLSSWVVQLVACPSQSSHRIPKIAVSSSETWSAKTVSTMLARSSSTEGAPTEAAWRSRSRPASRDSFLRSTSPSV
jgi:hypothetical protein